MPGEVVGEIAPQATPTRWWQWFVLYPTIAVSVLSTAPAAIDKVGTFVTNWTRKSNQPSIYSLNDAQMQKTMWLRNDKCDTFNHVWVPTSANIRVDTTICPQTGDVLVQALASDNRQFQRWISSQDEVIQDDTPAPQKLAAFFESIDAAHAETWKPAVSSLRGSEPAQFRLVQMQIVCQRQLDFRTLIRRVATPQGCIDQIIDMYSGQVLRQGGAPCVPQC